MFIAGAGIFLLGSMLSGLAVSMPQLIAFRAIQGLGAGALTTNPYTIIGDLYPFEQRAKVQGWMSSIWGIAGITGPPFYMNLPFGIVALVLLMVSMKEVSVKQKRHIDYPGIAAFAAGMFAFLYALTTLGEPDVAQSRVEIILLLAAAVILFTLFYYIEKRTCEPIIPLQLTSFTVAVTSAVSWELRGAAVGSNNFIRTLGQTVGISMFGLLLNTGNTETIDAFKLEHSLHRIFLILGVM